MIRGLVEGLLGPLGRQLLFFYEANSLPINTIVILYGFIILMSWTSLIRIYRHLVVLVARQIHENPDLDRKSSVKRIRETVEIPWQEAVDAATFPLIARQTALWPRRRTVENARALLDEDEIAPHALDVLKGTPMRHIRPSFQLMRKKEVEQHAKD